MSKETPIPVARGDGIGPGIMNASLRIIQAGGAELDIETIEIGEKVYLRGTTLGIYPSSRESLRRAKVFHKAPITAPQGEEDLYAGREYEFEPESNRRIRFRRERNAAYF
jgi:isocitrate dehydrogenase